MSRTALLAGATGLVGQLLLQRLLLSPRYEKVKVLSRRPLGHEHTKLETLITDFNNLAPLGDQLAADDVFCCLGTTLKKAGSRAAFERVDYHMVVDLARAARIHGARQFVVISAAGTAAGSPSFYSRVKARMEQAVADSGYDVVHILRPSLLLGARAEHRPAEQISQLLAPLLKPLFVGSLLKYRPVSGDEVAAAMEQLAATPTQGVHVHHLPLA
jgi:uncharacterized protein YbjT (DUF2867 family)